MKFLNSILCIALPCVMLGITGSSCMEPLNDITDKKVISNVLSNYEFKVGHNWLQVKINDNTNPINSTVSYNNETYEVPFYRATVNINEEQEKTCYCIVPKNEENTIYIPLINKKYNNILYLRYTTSKPCNIGSQLVNLYNKKNDVKFDVFENLDFIINVTNDSFQQSFRNNWVTLQQAIKKNNMYNNSEMNVDSNINIINNINEINTNNINNINNSNLSLKSNEEISNKKEIYSNNYREMIDILGEELDLTEYKLDAENMNGYDINDFKLYTSPSNTDKLITVKLWNNDNETVTLKVKNNSFVICNNDREKFSLIDENFWPIGVVEYKNDFYLAGCSYLYKEWILVTESESFINFLNTKPISEDKKENHINENMDNNQFDNEEDNKSDRNSEEYIDCNNKNNNINYTNNINKINNDYDYNIDNINTNLNKIDINDIEDNNINNNSFSSWQQGNNMNDKQQQIENTLKQIVDNVDISYINEPYAGANREINKDSITINLLEYLYAKLFTNNKDAELGNPYKIAEIANSYILSNYDNNISFSVSEDTFNLIQYYLMQKKEMD